MKVEMETVNENGNGDETSCKNGNEFVSGLLFRAKRGSTRDPFERIMASPKF